MIGFEEFKKIDLRAAKVKEAGKDRALIDLGERRLECSCAGLKLTAGDCAIVVVDGDLARLLAVRAPDGSYRLVAIHESVAPGTRVE